MKPTNKLLLAALLALPLAACGENNAATNARQDAAGSATAAFDKVKEEAGKMFDGQLGDVGKQVTELQSKASSLTGEKKTEVDGLLKEIVAKKDGLMKMFGDMKGLTSGGANFDGMKEKLTSGIAEIKKLIETAMAKMK